MECRGCSHRFLGDPPSQAELAAFYDRYYAADARVREPGRPTWRDRALVPWLRARLPPRARVLDIGANFGSTLLAMPSRYTLEGVETSEAAAASAARSPRLTIHHGLVEDVDLPEGAYDCVISLAVIEHVMEPAEFLARIRRLLRPDGLVLLMTGDYRSATARRLGEDWSLYHSLGHLHFFSALSLELAMFRAGLPVEDRFWTGPNAISERLPGRARKVLRSQTAAMLAPGLLARAQEGDHVYVWGRAGTPTTTV